LKIVIPKLSPHYKHISSFCASFTATKEVYNEWIREQNKMEVIGFCLFLES